MAANASASRPAKGKVVAIDLLEMAPIAGVDFLQLDFLDPSAPERLHAMRAGARPVLSDMEANATPQKTDQLKSSALVEAGIEFRPARCCVRAAASSTKVLQGGTDPPLLAALKRDFCHRQARQAAGQPRGFGRAVSAGDGISRRKVALLISVPACAKATCVNARATEGTNRTKDRFSMNYVSFRRQLTHVLQPRKLPPRKRDVPAMADLLTRRFWARVRSAQVVALGACAKYGGRRVAKPKRARPNRPRVGA